MIRCEWTMCSDIGDKVSIDSEVVCLCPVHKALVERMLAKRDRLAKLLRYIRGRTITPAITKECWREIR